MFITSDHVFGKEVISTIFSDKAKGCPNHELDHAPPLGGEEAMTQELPLTTQEISGHHRRSTNFKPRDHRAPCEVVMISMTNTTRGHGHELISTSSKSSWTCSAHIMAT